MLIRVLAAITLLAAVSIWQVPQAAACTCGSATAAFTHSDGAFTGRVVAMGDADGKVIESDDFSLARSLVFEIDTAYKGDIQPLMVMRGGVGVCGVSPSIIRGESAGIMFFPGDNGEPWINLCTTTTPEFLRTIAERTGFEGQQVGLESGSSGLTAERALADAAASIPPPHESDTGTEPFNRVLIGIGLGAGLLVLLIGIRKWRTGAFIR